MKAGIQFLVSSLFSIILLTDVFGGSFEPSTLEQDSENAGVIIKGRVAEVIYYKCDNDGCLKTELNIEVFKSFKGQTPDHLRVVAIGGLLNGDGYFNASAPNLSVGDLRYFFLIRDKHGDLRSLNGLASIFVPIEIDEFELEAIVRQQGQAGLDVRGDSLLPPDLTSQRAVNGSGLLSTPFRFISVDQGKPIQVIVDVSNLPSGYTEEQAMGIVQDALDTWQDNLNMSFEIEGTEVFTQSANTINNSDRKIRLQLHDNFNEINDASTTLGVGGGFFSTVVGSGGRVVNTEFREAVNGYVVLDTGKSTFSNPTAFAEVLAHEIGHVLGLEHTSETSPEPDQAKRDALMYFRVHNPSIGAQTTTLDISNAEQGYPNDTPPFGLNRYLVAVSKPNSFVFDGTFINKVTMAGGDLQGQTLTLGNFETPPLPDNRPDVVSFSLSGNVVTVTPLGFFSDFEVSNVQTSTIGDCFVRFSDGLNLSPKVRLRVIGVALDDRPFGNVDGLPNSWMNTHFGSVNPVAGTSSALDDPDGDGLTNEDEFRLGLDPNDSDSSIRISSFDSDTGTISWPTARYRALKLERSQNLQDWNLVRVLQDFDNNIVSQEAGINEENLPGALPNFYRIAWDK